MLKRENLVKLDSIILKMTVLNNLYLYLITNLKYVLSNKAPNKGHCSETIAQLKK